MDKDQKFWICIITIIAIAIVLFGTSMNYFYTKRMITYTQNGYCENSIMGQGGLAIQKCE